MKKIETGIKLLLIFTAIVAGLLVGIAISSLSLQLEQNAKRQSDPVPVILYIKVSVWDYPQVFNLC